MSKTKRTWGIIEGGSWIKPTSGQDKIEGWSI